MANNASKRKFPAVVVGLKNLDNAKETIEDRVRLLSINHEKSSKKNKVRKALIFLLAWFELLATIIISLMQEKQSSAIIVFVVGLGAVVLTIVWMIMPDKKLTNEDTEIKKLLNYISYIERQKNTFDTLLKRKDKLIDYYITPYNDDWIFYFVTLVKDENGKEKAMPFDIYVDYLKIIKKGSYATFTIDKFNEEISGYKIQLELTQKTYDILFSHN